MVLKIGHHETNRSFLKFYISTFSQYFKIDSSYLSKKAFTVFTNRTFGQVATGQNTASLANCGAFDPVDESFTLMHSRLLTSKVIQQNIFRSYALN